MNFLSILFVFIRVHLTKRDFLYSISSFVFVRVNLPQIMNSFLYLPSRLFVFIRGYFSYSFRYTLRVAWFQEIK